MRSGDMFPLDSELVTRSVFHPRPEPRGCVPTGIPTSTACDGASVCGYLHVNGSSDVLLLLFHGNGEIALEYDSIASLYTTCGASCWVVDYRGYGRSTGTPSCSAMLADAEAVLGDIPRVGASVGKRFDRVIVMGRSLGSASAIHLASASPGALTGLILDSPYADGLRLIYRLGGPEITRPDVADFQDNVDKMRHCNLPTLIIHGKEDRIIPVTDARSLAEACPSPEKRLVEIPGAGHNNLLLVDCDRYHREIAAHVARASR